MIKYNAGTNAQPAVDLRGSVLQGLQVLLYFWLLISLFDDRLERWPPGPPRLAQPFVIFVYIESVIMCTRSNSNGACFPDSNMRIPPCLCDGECDSDLDH